MREAMVKLSESVEREREAFLACFRGEKAGLVYAPTPGGEGRLVSEDEAVRFICEFAEMACRHARRFGHSVWASVILLVVFGSLGVKYDARPFTALALASIFGWFFTAIVQRIERARFKWRIWARLERRPPVPALSRQEKIRRGYALTVWQAIGIALIFAVGAVLQAPSSLIPVEWRDIHRIAIALFCTVVVGGFLVHGALRLLRRFQGRA